MLRVQRLLLPILELSPIHLRYLLRRLFEQRWAYLCDDIDRAVEADVLMKHMVEERFSNKRRKLCDPQS